MIKRGKKPASRGFVNNIILESLMEGDKYGYEIIQEVSRRSDGKIVLKQPSLYSSLKRFEQKGYISSYWGDSDIGGRRHYYTITEPGRAYILSKSKSPLDEDDVKDEDEEEETFDEVSLDDLSYTPSSSYSVDEDNGDDFSDDYIKNLTSSEDTDTSEVTTDEAADESNSTEDDFDTHNLDIQDEVLDVDTDESSPDMADIKTITAGYEKQNILKEDDKAYLQPDLFEPSNPNTIMQEESDIDHDSINNSREEVVEESPTQSEIPLVVEKSDDTFFNWDEKKREAINSNKSYIDSDTTTTTPHNPALHALDEESMDLNIVDEEDTTSEKNDAILLEHEPRNIDNVNITLQPKSTQGYSSSRAVDYKNILGELYTSEEAPIEEEKSAEQIVAEELSNTPTEATSYTEYTEYDADIHNSSEDKLNALIEDGFKFKPYQAHTSENSPATFIRSNKLILIVSMILGLFQMIQVPVVYAILRATHNYNSSVVSALYICGSIGLLIVIYGLVRYFSAPDLKKPISNSPVRSWLAISSISVVILTILIFGINMMAGMQFSNISIFYGSIIVPIITTLLLPMSVILYYTFASSKICRK